MTDETKPAPKAAKKTKTKPAPKAAKFVYIGSLPETRLWDGQTVKRGEPFTPKTDDCAAACIGSAYFEAA